MRIYEKLQRENVINEETIIELNESKEELRKNAFGTPSSSTFQYIGLI